MNAEKETLGIRKHLFYSTGTRTVQKGAAASYFHKESGGLKEKKSPPTHKAISLVESKNQVTALDSTEATGNADEIEDHRSGSSSRQDSSGMIQLERPSLPSSSWCSSCQLRK